MSQRWDIFCYYFHSYHYIYTLSLHDALPIYPDVGELHLAVALGVVEAEHRQAPEHLEAGRVAGHEDHRLRSEEHTSELQSRRDLVCRLLLEKKKIKRKFQQNSHHSNCKSGRC